ncbi:MAG: hypothetical protein F6K17_21045, partial [Okeania sp. SIO3C4]|nr:hypothetical protein [Okeania sp. SIO3C4]
HVPEEQLDQDGTLTVSMQGDAPGFETYTSIGSIDLEKVDNQNAFQVEDTRKINYGTEGFETFPVDVPEALKGKTGKLKFEVSNGLVYLDNIFFGESTRPWKPSMNRAEAEEYTGTSYFRGKVFYHGTNTTGAQSISTTGVNPDLFDPYSNYGPGFYTGGNKEIAEEYANLGGDARVLDVMLKAKKVATFPFGVAFDRQGNRYYKENNLYDDYEEPSIAYTDFLKDQGNQGVEIQDLQFFVVYDTEQVVVLK